MKDLEQYRQDETFDSVLDDIDALHISEPEDEPEDEPNQTAPAEQDKPVEEATDEGEESEVAAEAEEESAQAAVEEEVEEAEPEDGGLIELPSGEKVTQDELVKKYEDWQKAYTRQRQADTEAVKRTEQQLAERDELYRDIFRDPALRAFLSEEPDALDALLAEPDATRQMIGNEAAVDRYWQRYEVLKSDPELAQRVADARKSEQAQAEVDQRAELEELVAVAYHVSRELDGLQADYDGVEIETVNDYILDRVGLTPDVLAGNLGAAPMIDGLRRLRSVFVTVGPDGNPKLDLSFAKDRFELLSTEAKLKAALEAQQAGRHNAQVDEELADEGAPKTPEGEAPLAASTSDIKEWAKKIDAGKATFQDYLESI